MKILLSFFSKFYELFVNHSLLFEHCLASGDISGLLATMSITKEIEDTHNTYLSVQDFTSSQFFSHYVSHFRNGIDKCYTYGKMMNKFSQAIIDWRSKVLVSFSANPIVKLNAEDRNHFFKEVNDYFSRLSIISNTASVSSHLDKNIINQGSLENDLRVHIRREIIIIGDNLSVTLQKMPNKDESFYRDFHVGFDSLRSIREKFESSEIKETSSMKMEEVRREWRARLNHLKFEAWKEGEKSDDMMVQFLIDMKILTVAIPSLKIEVDNASENLLISIKKGKGGVKKIGAIGFKLNANASPFAHMVIEDSNILGNYATFLRNEKTLLLTHEDVLRDLEVVDESEGPSVNKYLSPTGFGTGSFVGSTFSVSSRVSGIIGKGSRITIGKTTRVVIDELQVPGTYKTTIRGVDQPKAAYTQFEESLLYDLCLNHEKIYWEIVNAGRFNCSDRTLHDITRRCQVLASSSNPNDPSSIVAIVANVFAYWTLSDCVKSNISERGSGSKPTADSMDDVKQPTRAQIVSILRLLGVDDTTMPSVVETSSASTDIINKIYSVVGSLFGKSSSSNFRETSVKNHLVQIGTGEGKSVTLAVTSIVLALLGFSVDCVCYSDYLSRRDFEAFHDLFRAFGVSHVISYGTFNKLCEDVINASGSIREMVSAKIKGESVDAITDKVSQRPKILLIDEVDVFFNKDFYGNKYEPIANVRDPVLTRLIKYIWSIRHEKKDCKFGSVSMRPEYMDCLSKFRNWELLIKESVRQMLQDISTFDSVHYICQGDKIGYKYMDGISFNLNYGYKTLFAYFKEHELGNISKKKLESQISMTVFCGAFSYAEIPKLYYCLLGVTGTLKTLSNEERRVLEHYGIRKHTYMPSVYFKSNLIFRPNSSLDVIIVSKNGMFSKLKDEVNTRLKAVNGSKYERSVLVFFESTPKLLAVYNSNEFLDIKENLKIMTEETSAEDKEGIIRQAVSSGSVTLLNRVFGRGTDFICYDADLLASGGIHVISTFVSSNLAEESQIKGRTARMGNPGSFSMVLIDEELEPLGVSADDLISIQSSTELFDPISLKRNNAFEIKYNEEIKNVGNILSEHKESCEFRNILICSTSGNNAFVRDFVFRNNQAARDSEKSVRTVVLMDATGSMASLLQKAKHTVKTMFARINKIAMQEGNESRLIMQFVAYRNYSSGPDMILQSSPWASREEDLRFFIDSISVSGGEGNEAVEVGLWHVNNENEIEEVDQVILIGDMPPNTLEEISSKRSASGHFYSNTQFGLVQHFEQELQQLKTNSIPVHGFYVSGSAQESFEYISRETGGRSEFLDINSDRGADQLLDLCSTFCLREMGGEALVEAYVAMKNRGGFVS